jgi:hypothetical protein
MKNCTFFLILVLTLTGCHTETGGSYDFMSDQIGVLGFLINNWWIVVIAIAIFIIIGQTKKKKDN